MAHVSPLPRSRVTFKSASKSSTWTYRRSTLPESSLSRPTQAIRLVLPAARTSIFRSCQTKTSNSSNFRRHPPWPRVVFTKALATSSITTVARRQALFLGSIPSFSFKDWRVSLWDIHRLKNQAARGLTALSTTAISKALGQQQLSLRL